MRWALMAGLAVAIVLAGPPVGGAAAEVTAGEVLAQCPCEPEDKERFSTIVYPTALAMAPAPYRGFTPAQRVAAVTARLGERLADRSPDERARALAVFDEARLVMDVRLAAGLAMLVGTVGEPAVQVLLDENVFADGVDFEPATTFTQLDADDAMAAVIRRNGRARVIFQDRFQHEDFVLLAPTLLHEALHSDEPVGRPEEATAHLLESFVATELLARYPDVADDKTELSRETLTDQLALIFNSDTVLGSRGELFPGGRPAGSYYDTPILENAPPVETPGSSLLVDMLGALGHPVVAVPNYSVDLLASLDVDETIDSPAAALSFVGADLETIGDALTVDFDPPLDLAPTTSTSSPSTSTTTSTTLAPRVAVTPGPSPVPPVSVAAAAAAPTSTTPTTVSAPSPVAFGGTAVPSGERGSALLARTGDAVGRDFRVTFAFASVGLVLLAAGRFWLACRRAGRKLDEDPRF